MGDTTTKSGPQHRRACEPCRRKKTRCTGERPTCSFCSRLRQPCTYATRHEDSHRVHKEKRTRPAAQESAYSQDRIGRLEERMEQMAATISDLSGPQATVLARLPLVSSLQPAIAASGTPTRTNEQASPLPSGEVISKALEAYRRHAADLGLSTGGTRTSVRVEELPEVMQRSLLALTLRFVDPSLYQEQVSAASFYKQSAMHMLIDDAPKRVPLERFYECIVLLVHADILDSQPASALMKLSMMFGTFGRGSSPRASCGSPFETSQPVLNHGDIDLAVLQSIYGGSIPQNHTSFIKRQLDTCTAASTCCPPAPISPSQADGSDDVKDLGIWTYMMTLKLSWGRLVGYLNDVKSGTCTESPWHPQSTYYELMAEIYDLEVSCLEHHRLNAVSPEGRSFEGLSKHQAYWNMWFSMQILYHAYQALLNHPLLLLHHRSHNARARQPPSFMQHCVDQAILHAGWVCRMIGMWNATGLNISDPFIGYLVGAAATVHFLLCFARDESVVEKATENFGRCCSLVSTISLQWDHLNHTKSKLDKLEQILAEHATQRRMANLSKLSSETLWNLLDYATSASDATTGATESVDPSIDTIFLSPLAQHNNQTPARSDFVPAADLEVLDETLDWEALGFTDEPGILFPVDLWTNGQL